MLGVLYIKKMMNRENTNIIQDTSKHYKNLEQHYQDEINTYTKNMGDILYQPKEFFVLKTLEQNNTQYLAELRNIDVLREAGEWIYVGVFKQKSPQESMLSLQKSLELGREFQSVGAKEGDTIKYDKYDEYFYQFILTDWQNIYWWYRFLPLKDAIYIKKTMYDNQTNTPVWEYFIFDEKWLEENKATTMELWTAYTNRKIVNQETMNVNMMRNIKWLGMIINEYKSKKYLGKLTIPTKEYYNSNAADFAIYYLEKFFKDKEQSITPKEKYKYTVNQEKVELFDELIQGYNLSGNWKTDAVKIRSLFQDNKSFFGNTKKFPWMFAMYLNISDNVRYLGTVSHKNKTLESGIMIDRDSIKKKYRDKYMKYTNEEKRFKKCTWENYTLWEILDRK